MVVWCTAAPSAPGDRPRRRVSRDDLVSLFLLARCYAGGGNVYITLRFKVNEFREWSIFGNRGWIRWRACVRVRVRAQPRVAESNTSRHVTRASLVSFRVILRGLTEPGFRSSSIFDPESLHKYYFRRLAETGDGRDNHNGTRQKAGSMAGSSHTRQRLRELLIGYAYGPSATAFLTRASRSFAILSMRSSAPSETALVKCSTT